MPRRLPDSLSWPSPPVLPRSYRLRGRQVRRAERRTERADLVTRRRRALAALAGAVFLTALLGALGAVPIIVQLAADVALAGFLAHLRLQARRQVSDRHQAGASRPPAARVPAGARTRAQGAAAQPAAASAAQPPTERAVGYGAEWQPVPVPPPTYVTKSQIGSPDAPQAMLDLTRAGSNLPREFAALEDDDTQELDFVIEDEPAARPRAVND